MNPEVKAKWVDALRSGKYTQGQHSLAYHGAYCCLGVLCEINGKSPGDRNFDGHALYTWCIDTIGNERAARSNWGEWTGELIHMNDGGKSFAEIADYIEREL